MQFLLVNNREASNIKQIINNKVNQAVEVIPPVPMFKAVIRLLNLHQMETGILPPLNLDIQQRLKTGILQHPKTDTLRQTGVNLVILQRIVVKLDIQRLHLQVIAVKMDTPQHNQPKMEVKVDTPQQDQLKTEDRTVTLQLDLLETGDKMDTQQPDLHRTEVKVDIQQLNQTQAEARVVTRPLDLQQTEDKMDTQQLDLHPMEARTDIHQLDQHRMETKTLIYLQDRQRMKGRMDILQQDLHQAEVKMVIPQKLAMATHRVQTKDQILVTKDIPQRHRLQMEMATQLQHQIKEDIQTPDIHPEGHKEVIQVNIRL